MDKETTEEMEATTEKANPTLSDVMAELAKINKRLDAQDAQLEAIRSGLTANTVSIDRLQLAVSQSPRRF